MSQRSRPHLCRPLPGTNDVHGRILTDLIAKEWRTIDAFEDDMYELRRLTLTDGQQGWPIYVRNGPRNLLASRKNEWLAAEQLHRYLERCRTSRSRFDTSSSEI